MNINDVYSGDSWVVHFNDGFGMTTQVILGDNQEQAIKQFEIQTGFKVSRCTIQNK